MAKRKKKDEEKAPTSEAPRSPQERPEPDPAPEAMTAPERREKPAAEPKKAPKPDPDAGALRLSARQFVRVRKHRWERSAGFLLTMKQEHGLAKFTARQWQVHWDEYWKRPVATPKRRIR